MNDERNIGKFYITDDLIFDINSGLSEVLAKIKFIPLRVKHLIDLNKQGRFEYLGIADCFEPLTCGNKCPEYRITIHTKTNKEGLRYIHKVEAEKIK